MSEMVQFRLPNNMKDKIEDRAKEKGFIKPSKSSNISAYIRSLIVMDLNGQ